MVGSKDEEKKKKVEMIKKQKQDEPEAAKIHRLAKYTVDHINKGARPNARYQLVRIVDSERTNGVLSSHKYWDYCLTLKLRNLEDGTCKMINARTWEHEKESMSGTSVTSQQGTERVKYLSDCNCDDRVRISRLSQLFRKLNSGQ